MANAFRKVVALSCCLSLVATSGAWAQVQDGRDIRESWREKRRRTKLDSSRREQPRAYVTQRGQPGWRAPGDSMEMSRGVNVPVAIGGRVFDDIRMIDSLGYGLATDNTLYLTRIMGDASQQVMRLSPIGDVKDFFVYKGWPYYISNKNELRSIDESTRHALWRTLAPAWQRMKITNIAGALAAAGAGGLISGMGWIPYVNFHHLPWYVTSGVVALVMGIVLTARELMRRGTAPVAPGNIFQSTLATSVSAVRFDAESGDFEIDRYDSVTKTNKTELMSNLVGAKRARSIQTCADWLKAVYR